MRVRLTWALGAAMALLLLAPDTFALAQGDKAGAEAPKSQAAAKPSAGAAKKADEPAPDAGLPFKPGEEAVLFPQSSVEVPQAVPMTTADPAAYKKFSALAAAGDMEGLQKMTVGGQLMSMKPGTKVSVVRSHAILDSDLPSAVEVKILDGPSKGRVGWTPPYWLSTRAEFLAAQRKVDLQKAVVKRKEEAARKARARAANRALAEKQAQAEMDFEARMAPARARMQAEAARLHIDAANAAAFQSMSQAAMLNADTQRRRAASEAFIFGAPVTVDGQGNVVPLGGPVR